MYVARAHRVADANGGGRRHAKRHHEGQRRDVERDLMRPERHRIELSSERAGCGKDTHFERHLRRRWDPQRHETSNAAWIEAERHVRLHLTPSSVLAQDGDEEKQRHVDAGEDGRPRGTLDAERGRAKPAVDQRPVRQRVDEIGRDERIHHRPDEMDPLQVPAECRVQQQWQRAQHDHPEVGCRQVADRRVQTP